MSFKYGNSMKSCYVLAMQLPIELWLKVFENVAFLDLLQMRLVCKQWEHFITNTALRKTGKVLLCSDEPITFPECLEGTRLICETVELHKVDFSGDVHVHPNMEHIRCLTLYETPPLAKLPTIFPNLKQLEILDSGDWWQHCPFDLNCFRQLERLELRVDGQQKKGILQQLAAGKTSLQLVDFRLQQDHAADERPLLDVLETHARTLEHIQLLLFGRLAEGIEQWARVFEQMHKLHTITLCGSISQAMLFAIFKSLPATAPLQNVDLGGMAAVNDKVLCYIVSKWSGGLKKLSLMFCTAIGRTSNSLMIIQEHAQRLHTLHLNSCENIAGHWLVDSLANEVNHNLKELHVNGLPLLDEASLCTLAQRLPAMEELDLGNCNAAVTGKSLRLICRHMKRLRCLTLDSCSGVTSAALLGNGILVDSIQNLTKLETLSLQNCRNITNRGLRAISFSNLRVLTIGYSHHISSEGIEWLVGNCPELEELIICSCPKMDDASVLHIVCGLPRLRSLNLSNCSNLSMCSVDHIRQHCHALRVLVMQGIDAWNVCVAEAKLRCLRTKLHELLL